MFSVTLVVVLTLPADGGSFPFAPSSKVVRTGPTPEQRVSEVGLVVTALMYDRPGRIALSFRGMRVDRIRPNSPAARAGLRVGDIIEMVSGRDVNPFGRRVTTVETILGRLLMRSGRVKVELERPGVGEVTLDMLLPQP